MATKKKTTRKTVKKTVSKLKKLAKKPVKKRTVRKAAPKKLAAKKTTTHKKTLKKKTVNKIVSKKTVTKKPRKRVASSTARKRRILTPKLPVPIKRTISIRRIWYTVAFPVLIIAVAAVGFFIKNPGKLSDIQANLFSAFAPASVTEEQAIPAAPQELGFVLMRTKDDQNAQKLKEIFSTIFTALKFTPIMYDSAQGKRLVQQYKPIEIPTVLIPKQTFEKQDMVNVVSELFSFSEGYYVLKASVVNPDNQLLLSSKKAYPASMSLTSKNPQYTLQLFTNIKNIEARAHEKNILPSLEQGVDSGTLSLQIIDIPQDKESEFAAFALACLAQTSPQDYLPFRKDIISLAKNTTKSYIDRKLKRLIGNYSDKCDRKAITAQLKAQAKTALDQDGITELPALLIQRGQSPYRTRFTGNKAIADYQLGLEDNQTPEATL